MPPATVDNAGALAGLRVLDLGLDRAAYCGKLLAELGAVVVKVEPPSGDSGRRQPPFKDDLPGLERSLPFAYYNSSKLGITLDLTTRDGQELLRLLVQSADALVEAFDPGYLAALNLGADRLREIHPGLVVTSVSPFGQDGPRSHAPADDMVTFASGGVMYISGKPERPPVVAPGQQAYDIGSIHAAATTLMALWARRCSGMGQHVDVAMQECLATEEHTISRFAHENYVIHRDGSQHESAAPGSLFPCRDGYVHLFVTNSTPGIWERFMAWLGDPAALQDGCWADPLYRRAHVAELARHVTEFTMRHDKRALMEEAQARHIPCTAVNTPADLMESPHEVARQFFVSMDHPTLGPIQFPRAAYRLSETAAGPRWPAPGLGEHNVDIYCGELGLSRSELVSLYAAGIV